MSSLLTNTALSGYFQGLYISQMDFHLRTLIS